MNRRMEKKKEKIRNRDEGKQIRRSHSKRDPAISSLLNHTAWRPNITVDSLTRAEFLSTVKRPAGDPDILEQSCDTLALFVIVA